MTPRSLLAEDQAADLSHELRSPLNLVIGFSQLLLDGVPGPINDRQQQCLSDILQGARRLLELIDRITAESAGAPSHGNE